MRIKIDLVIPRRPKWLVAGIGSKSMAILVCAGVAVPGCLVKFQDWPAGSGVGGAAGNGGTSNSVGATGGAAGNGGTSAPGGASSVGGVNSTATGGNIGTGGGLVAMGGASTSGGATLTNSGGVATGGIQNTGGSTSSTTGIGGSATGGTRATVSSGGTLATGGTIGSAGSRATGGTTSTGGLTASGGTGGTGGTGTVSGSGGATSSGGTKGTGGTSRTGGAGGGGGVGTGGASGTGGSAPCGGSAPPNYGQSCGFCGGSVACDAACTRVDTSCAPVGPSVQFRSELIMSNDVPPADHVLDVYAGAPFNAFVNTNCCTGGVWSIDVSPTGGYIISNHAYTDTTGFHLALESHDDGGGSYSLQLSSVPGNFTTPTATQTWTFTALAGGKYRLTNAALGTGWSLQAPLDIASWNYVSMAATADTSAQRWVVSTF